MMTELRARRMIDKLNLMNKDQIRVVRDGEVTSIDPQYIVLDDIMLLSAGEQVPSDAVVVDGMAEHNDSEEKKIRPSLNSNQSHKNSKIEHIKGVKDITPKNLPVAGASFCFKIICFTGIYPPLDLHLRQAL